MHCKPREMRVVSIEAADRWGMGPAPDGAPYRPEGYSFINLTEARDAGTPTSSITLAVKNSALGKFPNVGQTITTDLFLRTAAENAA